MTNLSELDKAIKAVCPIDGVSIGKPDDKGTWKIHFRPEATTAQRALAQAEVNKFLLKDLTAEIKQTKDRLKSFDFKTATQSQVNEFLSELRDFLIK